MAMQYLLSSLLFGCQIKTQILPLLSGADFGPEVWYIFSFCTTDICILIYFESPFWHALVAFYLQLYIFWSFYHCSFCTLLQLISPNKYWHLTSKLDIELRGLLHIAQKGKRINDFKSYFQHAKKEGYILHNYLRLDLHFSLLSIDCRRPISNTE